MRCNTCRKKIHLKNYRYFRYNWDQGFYEFYTCSGKCGDIFLSKYGGYKEEFTNRKVFEKEEVCWEEVIMSRFEILDL